MRIWEFWKLEIKLGNRNFEKFLKMEFLEINNQINNNNENND